ncbi:NUDIX domain-containing protein, partial [Kitasatospora sp. MBT63]
MRPHPAARRLLRRRVLHRLPRSAAAAHLVHHPGEYQYPGGLLDPGEDPWQCALRETGEEIGFVPASLDDAPRLLLLSFTPPEPPWPWKIGVTFDGGRLTDEEIERITLDPAEHSGHAVRTLDEWSR